MCNKSEFVLIVTIVKKGWGDEVIKASIAKSDIEDDIRNSIIEAINLNEPGTGIGFVVSLDKVFGICHPFYEMGCPEKET